MPPPSEDEVLKQFFNFYFDRVRPELLRAESYIRGALTIPLIQLRDAFDDLGTAISNEELRYQKLNEAIGHLRIAGVEAWEVAVDIRLEDLSAIISEEKKVPRRWVTSSKVLEHLEKEMRFALMKIAEGRAKKSIDYDGAVRSFREAFEAINRAVDLYHSGDLPGGRETERKWQFIIRLIAGAIIAVIAAVLGFILGKST